MTTIYLANLVDATFDQDSHTYTLTADYTVSSDKILIIQSGQTLEIPTDITLTNEGGTIDNSGTIDNNSGEIYNFDGVISNNSDGVINNNNLNENFDDFSIIINDGGTIDNSGTINNNTMINNEGVINNDGTINNDASYMINEEFDDGDGDGGEGTVINNTGTINNYNNSEILTRGGTIYNLGGTIDNTGGKIYKYEDGTIESDVNSVFLGNPIMQQHTLNYTDGYHTLDDDIDLSNQFIGIEADQTLTIPSGSILTLNANSAIIITEEGKISNDGTINNEGGAINIWYGGEIHNIEGTINNNTGGAINNNGGEIFNYQYGKITNLGGEINNNSEGVIYNSEGGAINNSGIINNNGGTIDNSGTIDNDDGNGFIYNCGGSVSGINSDLVREGCPRPITDFKLIEGWNMIGQSTYDVGKFTATGDALFYKFENGSYTYSSGEDGVTLDKYQSAWVKVSNSTQIAFINQTPPTTHTIEIADWVLEENKDININDTVTWKNNTGYSINMSLYNNDTGETLAESQELQVDNDFSYTFENTGEYAWDAGDAVAGPESFYIVGFITVQN
jgi:plastocyanin